MADSERGAEYLKHTVRVQRLKDEPYEASMETKRVFQVPCKEPTFQ